MNGYKLKKKVFKKAAYKTSSETLFVVDVANECPLVTIGIPTYNRPEGLRRALTAITSQTYQNLDIIISDNCSTTPQTSEVIREFMLKDKRIRFFKQKKNIGPVNNFNFLVKQAKGDYFMWATDDDYFDSDDLIEKLMNKMLENKNYVLVFPDFNYIYENRITRKSYSGIFNKCRNDKDYLLTSLNFPSLAHQIYGLFNLKELERKKISLEFDPNYNEQLLLYKLFFNGGVRFVSGVSTTIVINKRNFSVNISPFSSFFTAINWFFKMPPLILNSNLNFMDKFKAVSVFFFINTKYMFFLLILSLRYKNLKRLVK